MNTPRSLRDALRKGFGVTAESELSDAPENNSKIKGKLLLELGGFSAEGYPRSYELVVPYTVTYRFGKPRALRASDKF